MENPNRPRSTDLDDVVVRWRAAARADGWRSMADWQVPSIGEVVADAVASADAAGSARRLGIERARAGAGVEEGLDDLDRLWHLLGDPGAPPPAVRAFAAGWADEASAPAARPAFDPVTGLATQDVLRLRLLDLIRTGAADGAALLAVDAVDAGLPRFARHLEVAAIGELVGECFASAESPARLPRDRVAAILPRDDAIDEGVVRLRRALARRTADGDPDRVRVCALPGSAETVDAWLATR